MLVDFFTSLVTAFAIIFVMELGDKTQLVILTLSSRGMSPRSLAIGAMAGFAIIVFLGGAIAGVINALFPLEWISLVASVVFLLLGIAGFLAIWKDRRPRGGGVLVELGIQGAEGDALDGDAPAGSANREQLVQAGSEVANPVIDDLGHESKIVRKQQNAFLAGLLSIVTMELGDKTQLATIVLATASASFVGTLIGAWGALSFLALVGAFAGGWLSTRVPKPLLDVVSAALFIGIGVVMLLSSYISLFG